MFWREWDVAFVVVAGMEEVVVLRLAMDWMYSSCLEGFSCLVFGDTGRPVSSGILSKFSG